MATIVRIRNVWQNWPGAPGYTSFYAQDAPSAADLVAVRNFWDAIKALLPTGLTVTVPSNGDVLEATTGAITGSWSQTSPGLPVGGTAAGAYAGNAGSVVHWLTAGVVAGRRVRGRSFLVPLSGAFDTGGSLSASALGTLQTAASGLVSAFGGRLVVWSRPTVFRSGSSWSIVSASVPDLSASLKSRRT